ncbi:MAG: ADP-ribosyltransferase [Candidatus Gastranaerophilales bacterium]|nr:ADP-ribosyltransferase [Candidatus Gastranaerophilales bacterium]
MIINPLAGIGEKIVKKASAINTKNAVKTSIKNTLPTQESDSFIKTAVNQDDCQKVLDAITVYEKKENIFGKIIVRPGDKPIPPPKESYNSLLEIKTVHAYQLDETFAHELREGKEPSLSVRILDKIIKNSTPLEEDAVVFRSIQFDKYNIKDDLVPGKILQDKAFGSTSKSWDYVAKMWKPKNMDEGITFRIKLPAGTKGINCAKTYTEPVNFFKKILGIKPKTFNTKYPGEFILPRGYELKIQNIDNKNGIVDCDYLLPIKTTP